MNYLISVVNPGAMDRVCEIAAALDLPQTVTLLGHGTAVQSMLDLLGIESTEKRVIMTVANPEKTRKFIKEMRRQVYIGIPGHGIIMAVPIKSVGGGKTLAYLNNGEQQPARYTPELSNRYELIVIVANEGRTDQVMNAARAAGATGGTVLHGKGTLGEVLGAGLATGWTRWLLIPLSMLLGWFIISAEPAVAVLEAQIEEVSAGTIPGSAIKTSLSIAIALAMGFSMLRVLTGISIMWFLIPGYVVALGLSFFVPDLYTAIAFDSGGVASGPMTATFMLQFMIGASTVVGGNPLIDAFGVVAMVAMMPLISIQMVGFIYSRRTEPEIAREQYGDDEIIELWEVNAA